MFLKSLILRGFKTFADLTEVEFAEDARITAIVGPNGCGKSNFMDATRWALGEDNPRELRVGALSNIIFAGTASRKALSMAEVTLVFDNASGKFPIPFSEVAIKRRTYREGESEFLINKNVCRLKDIKDLLRDTGLGEGTYSIITQGQVDAILSSKGEERRMVFEEAAGINKYKSRKLAAQKKLIAAEQNILRINDLKIEVGENLITLEDQAKKATTYLQIQAQVKETDIALCKKLLINLIDRRGKLNEELARVKKESEQKIQSEEKDVEELQALRERHRNMEREIDEMSSRLEQEKDRLRDIELDRRFIESELKREENRTAGLADEKNNIQSKIAELGQQLEQERKGFDFSSTPLPNLFSEVLAHSQQLIKDLSVIFLSIGGKEISLSLGNSKEKEEALSLKKELLEEEAKRISAEEEKNRFGLHAHRSELESIKTKLAESEEKRELINQLNQKKQEKESLLQKSTELEEKIRKEDQDERKTIGEEASLEIALAKLEGELNNLNEKLSLEYNLSQEEALASTLEITSISKSKREVEEGKARMHMLEPVNLLAVEEFEKGQERLSFIETQLADLNSARDYLQNLITELDLKAEQTFLKTMNELSFVFSETFAKLFTGGEAKITLSPNAPPLEADIDISVRPSGRKWLPLSMLSGGERSLSAIAILFSLLKIRPSPFCFLDEVDAALDDANIGRFANMLKDFSAESQIVVITHNKRTMSVADNMYGITMEEAGVSKVISMKLSKAVA